MFLGLAIAAVGIAFTLDSLGWFRVERLFEWLGENWPVGLLLVGLSHLIWAGEARLRGLVWIAIGLLLLAPDEYRLQAFDLAQRFWPLALVGAGLMIVLRALRGGRHRAPQAETAPHLQVFTLLGSSRRRNASVAFAGGTLTVCLGGCEVDLSRASLAEGDAVLDVFALWGGIEIRVPKDWAIDLRVTPVLGGSEDSTSERHTPSVGCLRIRGLAIMGGVEVKS